MESARYSSLALSETLLCPACNRSLRFDGSSVRICCTGPAGSTIEDGIVRYDPALSIDASTEIRARDRQAHGYLTHDKFPIQVFRIGNFVRRMAAEMCAFPVMDLGCGPGPTTEILVEAGFRTIAIDFSLESLKINALNLRSATEVLFVQADLRRIRFVNTCVAGLMMADFLQHLVSARVQKEFLDQAFRALVPGGWFFLSFFNVNVKNWFKGDVIGAFANGAIPYRRLTPREVVGMLPADVVVTEIIPMNISHAVNYDRILARLPFARLFARMVIILGRKIQS